MNLIHLAYMRARSSVGRALRSQRRGRGFDPLRVHQNAAHLYARRFLLYRVYRLRKYKITPIDHYKAKYRRYCLNAGGGGRTRTVLPPTDFESVTSANSITSAHLLHYTTAGRSLSRVCVNNKGCRVYGSTFISCICDPRRGEPRTHPRGAVCQSSNPEPACSGLR